MSVLIANNASSPIAAPVTTGSTTVTVQLGNGVKFPALASPDFFFGTLISALNPAVFEIVMVTAHAGDVFTVTRAQDGTTAQAFSIGDTFALLPTRATENAIRNVTSLPTSTGSANAHVVTNTVPINAADEGVVQEFIPGFTNTGTTVTLDIDGTGAFPLAAFDAPVWPGMLVMGVVARVAFDGANYQLQNPQVDYLSLPTSGGSANAQTVVNPVNPIKAFNRGLQQKFVPGFTNTAATTFSPDGLAPAPILYRGAALVGGELQVGVPAYLTADNSDWNLENSSLVVPGFTGEAQVFTASGTFTPTHTDNYLIIAKGGGAGGGSGGGSTSPGGNSVGGSDGQGGSGGDFGMTIVSLVAGTPYPVVIGAGALGAPAAGAGTDGNSGSAGGDTTFNGVTIAGGGDAGVGGLASVTVNGKGLTGSNGGGDGGGQGGAGQNSANSPGNPGFNATGPGGGGGGGGGAPTAGTSEAGGAGGNGADGILVIIRV